MQQQKTAGARWYPPSIILVIVLWSATRWCCPLFGESRTSWIHWHHIRLGQTLSDQSRCGYTPLYHTRRNHIRHWSVDRKNPLLYSFQKIKPLRIIRMTVRLAKAILLPVLAGQPANIPEGLVPWLCVAAFRLFCHYWIFMSAMYHQTVGLSNFCLNSFRYSPLNLHKLNITWPLMGFPLLEKGVW